MVSFGLMNSGTDNVTPFSRMAFRKEEESEEEAPLLGSTSSTLISTRSGNLTAIGCFLWKSTLTIASGVRNGTALVPQVA